MKNYIYFKFFLKKIIKNILLIVPDELYLKIFYFIKFKKIPNLDNPRTFTEKMQYLKLMYAEKKYSELVDKYKVRYFVKNKIKEDIFTKLYWVGEDPRLIPYDKLPNKFVIKCNHGSGYNIIVRDKQKIDKKEIEKKIRWWLSEDYWKSSRENQYKYVEKKILIEELLEEEDGKEILDYKFFCFHGKPEFIQVDIDRFTNHKRNLYDLNWNKLDFGIEYEMYNGEISKPLKLEKMIEYATILSEGLKFARVDFYEVNGKIYFGEITLTPGTGLERFLPYECSECLDFKYGKYLFL